MASTSYAKYSGIGGGGGSSGIPTYANQAALPASASDGATAITLDTDTLWIFNLGSMMWIAVGGSGVPLSVGTLDGQTASTNGAVFASNQLFMQSASATRPGLVNNTTQSMSGNKTFTGTIGASNLSGTNTGDITVAAFGSTPNSNGLTLTGQALNLQPADATRSGGLSSTDWNTFNNKQSTLTLGNLTDAGTDGIVVTGGTGAVVGSGTSIAQHVADVSNNGYLSSTDWATFNGKQAAGNYITALTGDVAATGPGSVGATLATVNSNVGSFGSSTSIPSFTVNAKGLITAASGNVVIAPAGTLSGTTLAANVVTSSLTTVGTIGTGTWQGTAVAIGFGGTGQTSKAAAFDALSPMTTGGDIIYGGASGTGTRLTNGSSGQVLTSQGGTSAPIWGPAIGLKFYASSQVTTDSSAITSTSFATFDNSPALTFTPTVTGSYRVWACVPLYQGGVVSQVGYVQIFNTTGSATLLYSTTAVHNESGGVTAIISVVPEAVYTLTASTMYVFDVQGKTDASGSVQLLASFGPFYMFAELCG